MFEYQVLTWHVGNVPGVLKRLNGLGAEGWEVVGTIGNTILLCRTVSGGKVKSTMNVYITGDKNE